MAASPCLPVPLFAQGVSGKGCSAAEQISLGGVQLLTTELETLLGDLLLTRLADRKAGGRGWLAVRRSGVPPLGVAS